MEYPYTDMCYAASEAYYHLAGGKEAGLTPVYMPVPGLRQHWAIREADGTITDLTVEQFGGLMPDYDRAIGCGFLTKQPSKRACALLEDLLY